MKTNLYFFTFILILTFLSTTLFAQGSINGYVWREANGNGLENGESKIKDIVIEILKFDFSPVVNNNGEVIRFDTTNAEGFYQFNNLPLDIYYLKAHVNLPWQYSIPFVNPSSCFSSSFYPNGLTNPIVLSSSDFYECVSLALYKKIKICGTVWIETDNDGMQQISEARAEGIEVSLIGGSGDGMAISLNDVTDSTGEYCFDVKPGLYEISVLESNFGSGNPLDGLISCFPTFDTNDATDQDDNGDGPPWGPVSTNPTFIFSGQEPQDMGDSNNTIDFCFTFDCSSVNVYAEQSCDRVKDTFCNLTILGDGCFTMFPGPLVQPAPNPLCEGGGVPHNMSWFAFIAGAGDYEIEIIPQDCIPGAGGQLGIQMGIYTDCTFSESVFCKTDCSTEPIIIPSDTLIPGNVYYLWFDGCSGSVCSYNININGDFAEFDIPDTMSIISTYDSSFVRCQYTKGYFKLAELPITSTLKFDWRIIAPDGDTSYIRTNINWLDDLAFDQIGTYRIGIMSVANKCNRVELDTEIVIKVVDTKVNEDFGIVQECSNNRNSILASLTSSDPNMDGIMGWQYEYFYFKPGLNTFTVNNGGCQYIQTVNIEEVNEPIEYFDLVLCPNQLPYKIMTGTPFLVVESKDSFLYEYLINDSLFCKGRAIINASILNMEFAFAIERLNTDSLIIQINNVSLLSDVDSMQIRWYDASEILLVTTSDTSQYFLVPNGYIGIIKVEIVLFKNGVSCAQSYNVTVNNTSSTNEQWFHHFSINPNPGSDFISVNELGPEFDIIAVGLFSLNGQKINVTTYEINNIWTVETNDLQNGLYLVHVLSSNGRIYYAKWIKVSGQ